MFALDLAFLFAAGSVAGWVLEVFFRKFFSSGNPEHRWMNPGFCAGPYLPIYGTGVVVLYLLTYLEAFIPFSGALLRRGTLFLLMALCMTVIEYIGGIALLKFFGLRLWDYRGQKGNIQGVICPLFSFFWAVLGAVYYFLLHPGAMRLVRWLSDHLLFSFFIGMFYGIFLIDLVRSAQIVAKVRKFARESGVIVRFEQLKLELRERSRKLREKVPFMLPFRRDGAALEERLKEFKGILEQRAVTLKARLSRPQKPEGGQVAQDAEHDQQDQ